MFKQIGDVMITSKSHIQTIFLCEQLGSFKPLVPCKFLQHGSLLAYSTYWRLKVIDQIFTVSDIYWQYQIFTDHCQSPRVVLLCQFRMKCLLIFLFLCKVSSLTLT